MTNNLRHKSKIKSDTPTNARKSTPTNTKKGSYNAKRSSQ